MMGAITSIANNNPSQSATAAATLQRIKYYFASRLSTFNDIWSVCHNLSDEINEQVLDVFCLTL